MHAVATAYIELFKLKLLTKPSIGMATDDANPQFSEYRAQLEIIRAIITKLPTAATPLEIMNAGNTFFKLRDTFETELLNYAKPNSSNLLKAVLDNVAPVVGGVGVVDKKWSDGVDSNKAK